MPRHDHFDRTAARRDDRAVAGTLAGDVTNTANFALTGANQGNGASGQFYTGFGAASGATTITGAVNFDDGAKGSEGMSFGSTSRTLAS